LKKLEAEKDGLAVKAELRPICSYWLEAMDETDREQHRLASSGWVCSFLDHSPEQVMMRMRRSSILPAIRWVLGEVVATMAIRTY